MREERARSADQRQQHQPEDKQSPEQQQEVVVGQHQRLALSDARQELGRGMTWITGISDSKRLA